MTTYSVDVHPDEVLTADEAFPIFERFVGTPAVLPETRGGDAASTRAELATPGRGSSLLG